MTSTLKIGQGGTINMPEIGKCYRIGLLLLESQFKIIYQHTTAWKQSSLLDYFPKDLEGGKKLIDSIKVIKTEWTPKT